MTSIGLIWFLVILFTAYSESQVTIQFKNYYYIWCILEARFLGFSINRLRKFNYKWMCDLINWIDPNFNMKYCSGNDIIVLYAYTKYNFFNEYISDTIHIYMDRLYLSIFVSDFIKSGIWKSKVIDIDAVTRKSLKGKGAKRLKLPFFFKLGINTDKSLFLIDTLRALTYGWLSIWMVIIYSPINLRNRYLKLTYKNLIINKFMYKRLPINNFYIFRNLIVYEKYSIYSKLKFKK